MKQSLTGWLRENADGLKDREAVVAEAAKVFPEKGRDSVIRRMTELVNAGEIKPKPPTEKPKKSVAERPRSGAPIKKVPRRFRMAVDVTKVQGEYDDEAKIDEGIDNLGTSIIKDNDFRVELGIAMDRWKLVSSLEKYSRNKIDLRGKQFKGTYWGQEEVLVSLRKKIDMTD